MEEERVRSGELYFLGAMLLLLVAVLREAAELLGVFQGVPAGAGSLAQMVGVGAVLLVIGLAFHTRREGRSSFMGMIRYLFSGDVVLLLLAVIVYGLIMANLGFAISTFIFLLGTMFMLDRNNLRQKAIISLGTVVTIVLLFTFLFEVVLP